MTGHLPEHSGFISCLRGPQRLRRLARGLSRRRWPLAGVLLAIIAAGLAGLLWPMETGPILRPSSSPELLDRAGRTLHVFLNNAQQWCLERDLDRISPWLIAATIAVEDQRFRSHPGVDPVAVARAAWQNARSGHVVSGASTLEMQVIKLAGQPSHHLGGKLRQAAGALRLARHADKDAVLLAYLNRAPYGMNLVGCEAAARRYFGKPASELTLAEAALLAGLPRAPTLLMPLRYPERALARRTLVLRRMLEEGAIDEARMRRANAEPLGAAWHEFPAEAPHLAMRLRPAMASHRMDTTLDESVQRTATQALRRRLKRLEGEVENGAVIVLDTATARVLAHVGSPDFLDDAHAGQFDATVAQRSPGSTLKPFLYGLAIERNRLYPGETLMDDGLDLGRYNPANFDGKHRGLIAARTALRESLNIPALLVLDRTGERQGLDFLRNCGLTSLDRTAADYGAGLALGNCEGRLDQLAAAYAMLANLGEWRPVLWLPGEPQPARRLLRPGTAAAVIEMLRQPLPGEIDKDAAGAAGLMLPVAWKTGTSTGNHDAWCFMFNAQYVIGVWMGNHDGRPSPRLVGAEASLPLASEIFRALPRRESPAWPTVADHLRVVTVCALSGLPVCDWCPHTRQDLLPRRQHMLRRCDVHGPSAAGIAAVERWPGQTKGWDLARIKMPHVQLGRITEEQPASGGAAMRALSILEPPEGALYVLTGLKQGDRLRPRTSMDDDARLHWYLDDVYLGESAGCRPLELELTPGEHRLVCVAPGRALAKVRFKVQQPARALEFD